MTGRLLTQADMARRLNITLDHFRRHWRGWVQAGALCPPARSPGLSLIHI